MTEHLSPDLDMAHQFIRLVAFKWNNVGDDLSMELRALGRRPQSLRFNPKNEDEVAAVLETAAELNASGSNIHVTVNPAGPITPDCKTRALKDADIIAATATFVDADERGSADDLPDKALAKPDLAVITGSLPFPEHIITGFRRRQFLTLIDGGGSKKSWQSGMAQIQQCAILRALCGAGFCHSPKCNQSGKRLCVGTDAPRCFHGDLA